MTDAITMSTTKADIEKLDDYVRKNPDDSSGYIDLARAHSGAGNTHRAREVLDKLLNQSPDEGAALILRAELLAQQHDWIGAWRDVKEGSRQGAQVNLGIKLKAFYMQWIILHNQGWRPEALSRYIALVLCSILGILLLYMSYGALVEGGIIGALLVFAMGTGFLWAGLAIGGLSLWLKKLQDGLTPGWDTPVGRPKSKSKKKSGTKKEKSK